MKKTSPTLLQVARKFLLLDIKCRVFWILNWVDLTISSVSLSFEVVDKRYYEEESEVNFKPIEGNITEQ